MDLGDGTPTVACGRPAVLTSATSNTPTSATVTATSSPTPTALSSSTAAGLNDADMVALKADMAALEAAESQGVRLVPAGNAAGRSGRLLFSLDDLVVGEVYRADAGSLVVRVTDTDINVFAGGLSDRIRLPSPPSSPSSFGEPPTISVTDGGGSGGTEVCDLIVDMDGDPGERSDTSARSEPRSPRMRTTSSLFQSAMVQDLNPFAHSAPELTESLASSPKVSGGEADAVALLEAAVGAPLADGIPLCELHHPDRGRVLFALADLPPELALMSLDGSPRLERLSSDLVVLNGKLFDVPSAT